MDISQWISVDSTNLSGYPCYYAYQSSIIHAFRVIHQDFHGFLRISIFMRGLAKDSWTTVYYWLNEGRDCVINHFIAVLISIALCKTVSISLKKMKKNERALEIRQKYLSVFPKAQSWARPMPPFPYPFSVRYLLNISIILKHILPPDYFHTHNR